MKRSECKHNFAIFPLLLLEVSGWPECSREVYKGNINNNDRTKPGIAIRDHNFPLTCDKKRDIYNFFEVMILFF